MATFKTISELVSTTRSTYYQVVNDEDVIDIIKEALSEAVKEIVYKGYISKANEPYIRREDEGGLSDTRNYNHMTKYLGKNSFVVKVSNDTEVVGTSGDLLSNIIINGKGYYWRNSEIYRLQPYPRDFIAYAKEELNRSGRLKEIIKQKLKSKGIKVVD